MVALAALNDTLGRFDTAHARVWQTEGQTNKMAIVRMR